MGQEQLVMMTWNAPPFSDDVMAKNFAGYVLKHEMTGDLYSERGEMPRVFARKGWAVNCKAQRELTEYEVLPCALMVVVSPDTCMVFDVNGTHKQTNR